MKGLLIIALLAATVVADSEYDSDVLILTDDNFEKAIKDITYIFVNFHSSWDGNSKRLDPHWDQAASTLKNHGSKIVIAKIDCSVQQNACAKEEVHAWPTLKLFAHGQVVEQYYGQRTVDDIVDYVRGQTVQDQPSSPSPRLFSPDEIEANNSQKSSFWAVIDGYVVDATDFISTHPGGVKKIKSADEASIGYTGKPFGFSFSKGKNAHFSRTANQFQEGLEVYLNGQARNGEPYLPAVDVRFPPVDGKIVILGKLAEEDGKI